MGSRLHDLGILALCGKTGWWVGQVKCEEKLVFGGLGRRGKFEPWPAYLRLGGW